MAAMTANISTHTVPTLATHRWAELNTRDFSVLDPARTVAVLPLGATEQHGPHLPLSVDTVLVDGVVNAALAHLAAADPVLVLPTQTVGLSTEHTAFAGTLHLSPQTLIQLWCDLGASVARAGVKKLLMFNAHGGNVGLMEVVARELRAQHGLIVYSSSWYNLPIDAAVMGQFSADEHRFGVHAGDIETSMMLALSPQCVSMAEAQNFDRMHCQALLPADGPSLANVPDPKRKLRIGFVSADLRDHAVAYFVEPVWQELDRERFEIYAYYSHFATDHVTRRLKQLVTRWRGVAAMSDEVLRQQIRDDQVDILVDLSGHTAGNRLPVFARRAAPVQFGWLGHPATTGVKQMDYLLTNAYAEPVGMTEHLSSETLWRLPESYCVYRPGQNSPEVVDVAPCVERGYITFGCFNNLAKVTEDVIRVWSRILLAVPDSRLMLEWTTFSDPALCAEFASRFARYGVGRERLELVPRRKENQYKLYNQIDIALDPFPCNGGTTGFDTIWMGVPYITLAGHHLMSRMGVMILSNVGLASLIAENEDDYVGLAVKLAQDRDRLFELRHGLRDKMLTSPLMDAPRFARHFEAALTGMWQQWCEQQNGAKQS